MISRNIKQLSIITFMLFSFVSAFAQSNTEEAANARNSMISHSKQFVGVPYVLGGVSKEGMDCSGLIYTVARESIGLQLPRTVAALYGFVRIIPNSQKEPGDIVFFKTVGDKISHAGLYIGNNQFIHCVSDGPNTGVILSSLSENYWKNAYYSVGQILPATKANVSSSEEKNSSLTSTDKTSNSSFISKIEIDSSVFFNWNFFNASQFLLNPRGASIQVHAKYTNGVVWPGIGIGIAFEPKMKITQIPIIFSISLNKYVRLYAGPVFTIGTPILLGDSEEISASIFPGIMGVSWQTDNLKIGNFGVAFTQDISYTIFNNSEGAALNPFHSLAAGLSFSTGFRVTFPKL